MAKPKQAFVVDRVEPPACLGCSQCGDLDDRHLYILGYNNKYYCKVCFFKIATKWTKPDHSEKLISKGDYRVQDSVQEVQSDNYVQD